MATKLLRMQVMGGAPAWMLTTICSQMCMSAWEEQCSIGPWGQLRTTSGAAPPHLYKDSHRRGLAGRVGCTVGVMGQGAYIAQPRVLRYGDLQGRMPSARRGALAGLRWPLIRC